jgi:hypothetical protein
MKRAFGYLSLFPCLMFFIGLLTDTGFIVVVFGATMIIAGAIWGT